MMQVRALLHGQGWYDLRQYRINPPFGANIHWSRLVDLPIAGLILLSARSSAAPAAERWAVAIAPLLPYLLLLFSLALTARRLIDPRAFRCRCSPCSSPARPTACSCPNGSITTAGSWRCLRSASPRSPTRKRVRGGLTLGMSSALSLAIGLEMIIYLAVAGVGDGAVLGRGHATSASGCATYAVTLGGATALGFLVFASNDNRHAVCDALSPVWLSDALLASALMFGLALASPGRLAAAACCSPSSPARSSPASTR